VILQEIFKLALPEKMVFRCVPIKYWVEYRINCLRARIQRREQSVIEKPPRHVKFYIQRNEL
jgi:hypothetical protein